MLELFAIETGTNILVGIVTHIMAALNRLGGQSGDIDDTTPQQANGERMGGANNVQA